MSNRWPTRPIESFHLGGLGRDDSQIAVGHVRWIRGRLQLDRKIVRTRHSKTFSIQGCGVIFAPNECPDFRDPRQVRSVETSNCAASV